MRLPDAIPLVRYGTARELALPREGDTWIDELVSSHRVRNGVLHNPRSDRRTTQGTFHVCEDGLPIAGDKKAVPRAVFAALFRHAVAPPANLLTVPFAASQPRPLRTFFSLLLRPMVCPEVPGVGPARSMEVRFFAPGGLTSNLDFVESIFGNAGDPFLPENDAGLDAEHWTGHTGCVLLAPHLTRLTKRELGLPAREEATPRQRRDGMCWRDPAERYNDGLAFKVTCRDASGTIVTLIADNYFGYCKKEVKTQISFAANLLGDAEEEHAGGALCFARYNLGLDFDAEDQRTNDRTLEDVVRDDPEGFDLRPEGHAVDRRVPGLVLVPHDARASMSRVRFWWTRDGRESSVTIRPGTTCMTPSGYKVDLERHPATGAWRLVGTVAEGVFCHKPCTVSGGGKSEISKSLGDYVQYGPILVADLDRDFDLVQQILDRDYSDRWKPGRGPQEPGHRTRAVLGPLRTLGSVVRLLREAGRMLLECNDSSETVVRELTATAGALTADPCRVAVSYRGVAVALGDESPVLETIRELRFDSTVQSRTHEVLDLVRLGRLDAREALVRLGRIESETTRHPRRIVALLLGAGAAGFARLLGADPAAAATSALAAALGLFVRQELGRRHVALLALPLAAAFVGALLGGLAIRAGWTATPELVLVVPALMVVPGPHLLNGLFDLIDNHLPMSLARLGLAAGILLSAALGIVLGIELVLPTLDFAESSYSPDGLGLVGDMLLAGVATCGFAAFYNTPWSQLAMVGAVGMAGHGTRFLALQSGVPPEAATFLGGLVVGAVAAPLSVRSRAPLAVVAFAGAVTMIPGSTLYHALGGALRLARTAGSGDPGLAARTLGYAFQGGMVVAGLALGIVLGSRVAQACLLRRRRSSVPDGDGEDTRTTFRTSSTEEE